MPASRPTPLVVFGCAPADETAVRALAHRLSADAVEPWFAPDLLRGQRDQARLLRDAVRRSAAVVIAFSRRAWDDGGNLVGALAKILDVVLLMPGVERIVALKLSACTLPPGLEHADVVELFAYSGYERLRSLLTASPARQAVATPPQPAAPPEPSTPATTLRGRFVLPALERQGQIRRIGRGMARAVHMIAAQRALLISGGGAVLLDLRDGAPIWTIDCPARCGALSPRERLLALATGAQIVLWDLRTGQVHTTLGGHSGPIGALAFAPDERTLAGVAHDGALHLWRISDDPARPSGLLVTVPAHSDQATAVAFNRDGALIATGGADRTVRVWRLLDRALVQTLAGQGGAVETLAFSPDGTLLAAGSRGRTVRIWKTQTWQERAVLAGHTGAVAAVAFSADSARLASAAEDHTVRQWRLADGALEYVHSGHGGPVRGVSFSPDGALITSVGEDDRLCSWQSADGGAGHVLRPLSGRITGLAFSADGARLAQGSADGAVTVYGIGGQAPPQTRYNDHQGAITGIAFTADLRVVTSAADRTVRACRLADGRSAILLQTHGAFQVAAIAPDGRMIVTTDGASTVQLWQLSAPDAPPGGTFWRVLRGTRNRLRLVAFDAPMQLVALAGDDGAVRIWHMDDLAGRDADPAQTLEIGGGRIQALGFRPDGAQLAVAQANGQVQIWRLDGAPQQESVLDTGATPTSLAFAPNGRTLAIGGGDGTVQIWRVNGVEQRRRRNAKPATLLTAHANAVTHLAYDPTGGILATGAGDGTVRIWKG
jgi:WD40 repeat protein